MLLPSQEFPRGHLMGRRLQLMARKCGTYAESNAPSKASLPITASKWFMSINAEFPLPGTMRAKD